MGRCGGKRLTKGHMYTYALPMDTDHSAVKAPYDEQIGGEGRGGQCQMS